MRKLIVIFLSALILVSATAASPSKKKTTPAKTKTENTRSTGQKSKSGKTNSGSKAGSSKSKSKSSITRSSDKVRSDQKNARSQIKKTQTEINRNSGKVRQGVEQLHAIEGDIAVREENIRRTGLRIDSLNSRITAISDSVDTLSANVERLKNDYAASLRAIRRQRKSVNMISYVFAAKSFDQAAKRIRYITTLGKWRKAKTLQLKSAIEHLDLQRQQLDSARRDLGVEQSRMQTAKRQLDVKRGEATALVDELKKEGQSLNQELQAQQQRLNELNRELDRAIAMEVKRAEEERRRKAEEERRRKAEEERRRKAEEERRRKAEEERQRKAEEERRRKAEEERRAEEARQSNGNKSQKPATPATPAKPSPPAKPAKPATPSKPTGETGFAETERRLTGDFESNKGRLLFPVAGKYTIVGRYGRHVRPGTNVPEDNSGIDISTSPGAVARAVYAGEVVLEFPVRGTGLRAVLVRHGRYITVYSRLKTVSVTKGQKLKAGDPVGTIFTDPDLGNTILHFEIRHEQTTLNPLEWVR